MSEISKLIIQDRIDLLLQNGLKIIDKNPGLPPQLRDIFISLSTGEIDRARRNIEELAVKYPKSEDIIFLKQLLSENTALVKEVYDYLKAFDSGQKKINLFTGDHFIVSQEDLDDTGNSKGIKTVEDLEKWITNNQFIFNDGKTFKTIGVSNAQQLCKTSLDPALIESTYSYKNYEFLYEFMDKIDEDSQKKLSEHKIGIIIIEEKVYLIRFILMGNFNQPVKKTGKSVSVMEGENVGGILGVHVDSNFSLGTIVQFEIKKTDNEESFLNTVLTINPELLSDKKSKSEKSGSVNKLDIDSLILDFEDRIEIALSLFSDNTKLNIQDNEDLQIYTNLELQKIERENSLNTRINKLNSLLNLNKNNPDMKQEISLKLEGTYLQYLDYLYSQKDINLIWTLLKRIKQIKLFSDPEQQRSLFLMISYHMKSAEIPPKTKLETVEYLEKTYPFTSDTYHIFQDAYYSGFSEKAATFLMEGKADKMINSINPNFKTRGIADALISALCQISNKNKSDLIPIFNTVLNYIEGFTTQDLDSIEISQSLSNYLLRVISDHVLYPFPKSGITGFLNMIYDKQKLIFHADHEQKFTRFLFKFNHELINYTLHALQNNDEYKFDEKKNHHLDALKFYKKNKIYEAAVNYLELLLKAMKSNKNLPESILVFFCSVSIQANTIIIKTPNKYHLDYTRLDALKKELIHNWYADLSYPSSNFELHLNILPLFDNLEEEKELVQKIDRNITLKNTLKFVYDYNKPAEEIVSHLKNEIKNRIQLDPKFETEYFEHLEGQCKMNIETFYNLSTTSYHLNAVLDNYDYNNENVNKIIDEFIKNLASVLYKFFADASSKVFKDYLDLLQKFIPSILSDKKFYLKTLEPFKEAIDPQKGFYDYIEICIALYDFAENKMNKKEFTKDFCPAYKELVTSLIFEVLQDVNEKNTIIYSKGLNESEFPKLFRLLLQLITDKDSALASNLKVYCEFVLINQRISFEDKVSLIESIYGKHLDIFKKNKINIIKDLDSFFAKFDAKLKVLQDVLDKIRLVKDKKTLAEFSENLQEHLGESPSQMYNFHLLVIVYIKMKDIDSAIDNAIKGINSVGSKELRDKIIRNLIQILQPNKLKALKNIKDKDLRIKIETMYNERITPS